ncbi:hypothetical protein ACFX5F_14880 [Flavobacterium sp. ZS1P70]|uniref:CPXCG motif-containing cysteine-rich protein n=1 Tax=Flavobacterium zhoui TaxID=3230414 RepID=A0ABW6I8I5_9FLAO
MRKDIICNNCDSEIVVIENKLFFSEEEKATNIMCPICNNKMLTENTDGWFFIQTKEQYNFGEQIEAQKEKIIFNETL